MSLIFLICSLARADDNPYLDALGRAHDALVASDWDAATTALNEAQALAPASPIVLLPPDLARLDFYRGVIEWRAGDRNVKALDDWRRSLTLFPKAQPEADVLPDVEGQDAYYALASEVITRPAVPLGLPESTGDAIIFVYGARPEVGDETIEGRHFVQVKCADGTLQGVWYSFGPPPPDWLIVCNGGTYPSSKGRRAHDTVARTRETTTQKKPTERTATTVEKRPRSDAGAVWALVGTGTGLVAAGAVVNFLVVNPAWEAGQAVNADPTSANRAEANELITKYDRARLITLVLTGAGVAAIGGGISVGLIDADVVVGPGTLGLTGRW